MRGFWGGVGFGVDGVEGCWGFWMVMEGNELRGGGNGFK